MILEVPDEVVRAIQLPDSEKKRRLELELACALYGQGILSAGRAAQLAEISRMEFWEEAGKRGIPRHYSEEDLRQDLKFADDRK